MKFLIVGVGAIGSAFLGFLTKAGNRCAGLVKPGRKVEKISVEGIWGSFEVPVRTLSDPSQLDFLPDVVVISVKSYDTPTALRAVSKFINEGSYLLIAQNGYGNYERAVEIFGEDRVILSRIIFGSEVLQRGRIRITVSADDVVLGDPSGKIDKEFLKELAGVISRSGIPARYDREVYSYLWAKIIYNCALNPLGALLGVNYGWLADNPHTKGVMDGIIEEIFAVLSKKGIRTFWEGTDDYRRDFYGKLIPPTRDHYPSMLKDIKRGKTEIDSLNGAIVMLGKTCSVETPVNESITALVKARELLAHNR